MDPDLSSALLQALLANIRGSQVKLQENHERSKTVTRSKDMKVIREAMQASQL